MLSAASVEDDDGASVTPPSQASGSSSANSHNKKRSRIGSSFKAFQFHFMIKTDLRDGTTAGRTAVEKERLLKEHLRTSTGHKMPPSITGLVVFCDRSLFSQPPDSDGLVSIEVLGYVQAKSSTPLSTMKNWIDSATWKPVQGGLTSDDEYMSNMAARLPSVSRERQSNGRPAVLWLATRGLLRCRQRCRCARESARFK